MFIGHIGAGLACKKVDPKTNAGVFVLAALLSDILLWILVLGGIEQVIIPEDYAAKHYLTFVFPYSHGLLLTLLTGTGLFFLTKALTKRSLAAWGVTLAYLSHFILDFLVHPPALPLFSSQENVIGLGLWNHMSIALILEVAITLAGLFVYLRFSSGLSRLGKFGIPALVVLISIFAIVGQLKGPAPENVLQVAGSSLMMEILLVGLIFWFDRKQGNRD